MTDPGRPEYTDTQYRLWFDMMSPFFKLGETLNAAIEDAGLQTHRNTLYEKSRLDGWFSYKMRSLQSYPGKLANNILVKRLMLVDEKIKQGLPVQEEEMRDVRFIAEKHRSSQPYFVTRHEIAQQDPKDVSDILDRIEAESSLRTDYRRFAQNAASHLDTEAQIATKTQPDISSTEQTTNAANY